MDMMDLDECLAHFARQLNGMRQKAGTKRTLKLTAPDGTELYIMLVEEIRAGTEGPA